MANLLGGRTSWDGEPPGEPLFYKHLLGWRTSWEVEPPGRANLPVSLFFINTFWDGEPPGRSNLPVSLFFINTFWEGEPPGGPLFYKHLLGGRFSFNNIKHENMAHQEVRPPNYGFAPLISGPRRQLWVRPADFGIASPIYGFAPPISGSRRPLWVRPADFGIASPIMGSPRRFRDRVAHYGFTPTITESRSIISKHENNFLESLSQDPVERKARCERSTATIRERCEGFRPIDRYPNHAADFFDSISSTILPIESR